MGNRYKTATEAAGAARRNNQLRERLVKADNKRVLLWVPVPILDSLKLFLESARNGGISAEDANAALTGLATANGAQEYKDKWIKAAAENLDKAKEIGKIGPPGIPPDKKEEIVKLRASGLSAREVAQRTGVTIITVYKYSPDVPKAPRAGLSPVTVAKIQEMRSSGMSGPKVAEALQIPLSKVYAHSPLHNKANTR